jgi:hypothetical protein
MDLGIHRPKAVPASLDNRLVAVTLGAYCFAAAFIYSGGNRFSHKNGLGLLALGVVVALLDLCQIHAPRFLKRTPHESTTRLALWLNAIAIVGVCLRSILGSVHPAGTVLRAINIALVLLPAWAFLLGQVVSISNLSWFAIAVKPKIAIVVIVILLSLPLAWVAHREGFFTRDTGKYATRENRTIYLHPSEVSFQIPESWIGWDAKFHNNLHLTHRQLERVRFASGEWDTEYNAVVNSALPFEDCAAHVGGEGWGSEGVSFGDLQLRAYLTQLSSDEILKRISGPAFATAKRVSSTGFGSGGAPRIRVAQVGQWQQATIRYGVFYGDYGGDADVEFYLRPAGPNNLVLVFMGGPEKERQEILESVAVSKPAQP